MKIIYSVIYSILIMGAAALLILDLMLKKKERKIKNLQLVTKIENLSRSPNLKWMHDKEESKKYKKTEIMIMKSGLDVDHMTLRLIQYLLPLMVFLIIVIVKQTNIINATLNIDQLRQVSEFLGDESIANVNTNLNLRMIFLTSIPFYFIPPGILKLLSAIRSIKSQSEVLMLQTYSIIMLKTGQSVKQILIVLMERSTIFKPYLQRAINGYSQDPVKALKELKEYVPNKHFEKIVISLEQALRLNRNISIKYIETHRSLGKELNRINKRTRDGKKKLIGVMMLIVPLMAFIAIGGYPWLIFSLKVMNDMPF